MEVNSGDKEIIVIYHADCSDGFGAAFSAWKKFGNSAQYYAAFHKTTPPDIKNKDVYIFDYSYQESDIKKIKENARSLTMIDHHISSKEIISLADKSIFDNSHSASVLVWKYFFPEKEVPLLLRYVEDNDLWKFGLPHSKELNLSIDKKEFDFKIWDEMLSDFEDDFKRDKYEREGAVLLEKKNREVREIIKDAKKINFEGHDTLIVNSERYTSEVGNALAIKLPPMGIIWSVKNDKIAVSLRGDGNIDLSKIAEKYGGGGHKSAAGFVVGNEDELRRIFKLDR